MRGNESPILKGEKDEPNSGFKRGRIFSNGPDSDIKRDRMSNLVMSNIKDKKN